MRRFSWLGFGLLLVLTVAAATLAVQRVDRLARIGDDVRQQPLLLAEALLDAHDHAFAARNLVHDVIAQRRNSGQELLEAEEHENLVRQTLATVVAAHPNTPETLAPAIKALADWRDVCQRVNELVRGNHWDAAHLLMETEGDTRFRNVHTAISATIDLQRRYTEALRSDAAMAERAASLSAMMLALVAGGAVVAVGAGIAVFLRTHRPLMRLRSSLLSLAKGNVTVEIPHTDQNGMVGSLARALACLHRNLIERDAATAALKLSEDRLREAACEASRANEAKSRFLAAASHDLRQPLQAMRLYLDTLERRLTDPMDCRVLAGALTALSAGEDLLRNYLDVSLLESGIRKPGLEPVELGPILAELIAEISPAAAEKNLVLRLVPSNAMVVSDPLLLRRLLRNLLANAIRYTLEGSVLMGCRHRGERLVIEVWDTGIGIPTDKLTEVFEDFFQIGNSERDRAKGFGLGLSVVDRAARLLDHPVTVKSSLGKGSVFSVTVPLCRSGRTVVQAA